MRATGNNGLSDRLLFTNAEMSMTFQLTVLFCMCICLCGACPSYAFTIVQNWSISGENEEIFEMVDTCSFTVSFPNVVPPTYLLGYDLFGVAISDSMVPFSTEARPVLHFSFNAGFLYFDHVLTVIIPFSSPLIADTLRQSGQYRLYRDPFPYTGFHQWYADDSITIDSTRSLIRFVYHHPKYIPLQKSRKRAAVKIASTGYPFSFGIFFHPSIGINNRLRNYRETDAGFYCRIIEKKILITGAISDGNRKPLSYRVALFDGRGRRIGLWRPSVFPAQLSLSNHTSPGMYMAVLYQGERQVAVWPGIFSEGGRAP